MKLLLTGFEPFGKWEDNPSARIVAALHGREIAGAWVVGAVLPVAFAAADARLADLLATEAPDAVLCLGLGGGGALRVERVALNLDDNPGSPDNAGEVRAEVAIDPTGPAAYFAALPARAVAAALRERGVPAEVSNSAGTFLCNHVMYRVLRALDLAGRPIPAGFIHLPPTPELASALDPPPPSLPLEVQVRGVEVAVEVMVAEGRRAWGMPRRPGNSQPPRSCRRE